MATLINQASVPFNAGLTQFGPIAIPGGIKKANTPLLVTLSMGAEQFPNGETVVEVFISLDGGVTYRSAAMSIVMPASFRGAPPHFWTLAFSLGPNETPTHAKATVSAPSAFSTSVLITAV